METHEAQQAYTAARAAVFADPSRQAIARYRRAYNALSKALARVERRTRCRPTRNRR